MNDKHKFHLLKDLTFFATIVSSLLFSVGYLHETTYLENFGLNNSEMAPDISTSIVLGFRYAFLNTLNATTSIVVLLLLSLLAFDGFKTELNNVLNRSVAWSNFSKSFTSVLNIKPSPLYFSGGCILLAILISIHSIKTGGELASAIKKETYLECLTIKEDKVTKIYEGQIVRIRGGLIVFWEKKPARTHIFTSSNLAKVTYFSGCELGDE